MRVIAAIAALVLSACASAPRQAVVPRFYFGADLSYVNEMEDCGATYRLNGRTRDAYEIFRETGHNLVRVRIWNHADWTHYSDLTDVTETIRRTHAARMQALLDFHYSDDWADGGKQIIPHAWENIPTTEALAQALYQYTYDTLMTLNREGQMPEMVQVGNETNKEILGRTDWDWEHRPIDWARNAALLNAGIRAVRDAGAHASIRPRVMLHIAQPENVEPWFEAASVAGLTDFDVIGISYYRKWSTQNLAGLGAVIDRVRRRYNKDVIVVETSYPWTTDGADAADNILGADTLLEGYPATPESQLRYMTDITQLVIDNGGVGVVYWEPAWVSTHCSTRWGQGSHWENATFFDFHHDNETLPAARYPQHAYHWPTPAH